MVINDTAYNALMNENRILKEQIQDMTMRLSAIKVIVTKITPTCSEKLRHLLEDCEGCKSDNTHGN